MLRSKFEGWRLDGDRQARVCYIDVSDHSKGLRASKWETLAQIKGRKNLILLGNSEFRGSYFEPGGRGFESLRARQLIKNLSAVEHLAIVQYSIGVRKNAVTRAANRIIAERRGL